MNMPLSYTERKLKALQARRSDQIARINRVIRRRLGRFLNGKLSSEEFEKVTREERDAARLDERIMRVEDLKSTSKIRKVRTEGKRQI
jgi:hypothetical protein